MNEYGGNVSSRTRTNVRHSLFKNSPTILVNKFRQKEIEKERQRQRKRETGRECNSVREKREKDMYVCVSGK